MQVRQVPKPVPKENEVLVKVMAATVTAGDCSIRRSDIPLLFRIPLRLMIGVLKPVPGILGQEFSGIIEDAGTRISRFRKGDTVFGPTTIRMGAYAQYICVPEEHLTSFNPLKISFEEAATIPTGGVNALHFVSKVQLKHGEHVLINGAGGSIGTYALQIAKALHAVVTCVDSDDKLQTLRDLGADYVIDYRQQDFTKGTTRYNAIIDVVGKSSFSDSLKALNPRGRYMLGNPGVSDMIRSVFASRSTGKEVLFEFADYRRAHLEEIREYVELKKVKVIIDKVFPLEQIADAHRYVEAGKKTGNLVIAIPHDDRAE